MDNDLGELVDELNKLRLHDPESYRKRLLEIKSSDARTYNQLAEILGFKKEYLRPKNVFLPEKKRSKKESDNTIMFVIAAVALIGMFMVIMIMIFLSTQTVQKTSIIEPVRAVSLGHNLMFNSSVVKYLRFRFNYNISLKQSDKTNTLSMEGQEYVAYSNSKHTTGKTYTSSDTGFMEEIITKKDNNIIVNGKNINMLMPNNPIPASTLVFFDELAYIVSNELYESADSYDVGTIGEVKCAPLRFRMTSKPPSVYIPNEAVFKEMIIETCLSNEGTPLALGRYIKYELDNLATEKIFISELVTTDKSLITNVKINNRTINEWYYS